MRETFTTQCGWSDRVPNILMKQLNEQCDIDGALIEMPRPFISMRGKDVNLCLWVKMLDNVEAAAVLHDIVSAVQSLQDHLIQSYLIYLAILQLPKMHVQSSRSDLSRAHLMIEGRVRKVWATVQCATVRRSSARCTEHQAKGH